jgi:hypothetical protein
VAECSERRDTVGKGLAFGPSLKLRTPCQRRRAARRRGPQEARRPSPPAHEDMEESLNTSDKRTATGPMAFGGSPRMSCAIQAYASRTGTRRNLAALAQAGWRLLVSAAGSWRTEGFRYGIDNGAWTAFQSGRPFDDGRFLGLVERLGAAADFIVVPDIVLGGLTSLRFSEAWLPRLSGLGTPLLLPVQNGVTPEDVRSLLAPGIGIFVGGDSSWKESTLKDWSDLAASRRCHLHVGRVNSIRRIRLCAAARVDSFDGSACSRFALAVPRLNRAVSTLNAQIPLDLF